MNNSSKRPLPELLAPAGNYDSLCAAIDGGADAVYLGSKSFSCRMRANNFDVTELKEALSLCRTFGVRSYITINTRIKDSELKEVMNLVSFLCDNGVDAIIATDLALAKNVRERFPDLELHASTQLSGANAKDAEMLSLMGFSRMVCPRELSKQQIIELTDKSPIGIEMFIHGAHCASFSGQCLASYMMGGRSGNRGECAQPCRLPYGLGKSGQNEYVFSLKDMCLAGHVSEIIDLGVESLKIEGRQKSPEYVYGVTSVYRKLLDERRDATKEEIEYLSGIFSRDGFTDGYFVRKYGSMTGMRSLSDAEESKKLKSYDGLTRKEPLSLVYTAKHGERTSLEVVDTERNCHVKVFGAEPEQSQNRPLTNETAAKNLTRFGGTPYVCKVFDARIDDGLFVTPSSLNELRRNAVAEMEQTLLEKKKKSEANKPVIAAGENAGRKAGLILSAEFLMADRIPDEAENYFDEIYVSPNDYKEGSGYGINLPPVIPDEKYFPEKAVCDSGKVIVHSLGQIRQCNGTGAKIIASQRLNTFNKCASEELLRIGCDEVIASQEIPLAAVRDIGNLGVIVYGKTPTMLMLRCPQSKHQKCTGAGGYTGQNKKAENKCISYVYDRKGERMLLAGSENCINVLYNAYPVYSADNLDYLEKIGVNRLHFVFTDETKKEVAEIIRRYKNKMPPLNDKIRRLK